MGSDDIYRGDPPPYGHPQPYGAPPGYGAPGYAPPGYAPPGYAPPGYAPPGYGPPGGYAPYAYRRPTNTMAILALVFIFVCAPVSLVLGLVARRQIRETGEEGDGMALAGVIVGGISVGLLVLGIVFFVVAASTLSFGP